MMRAFVIASVTSLVLFTATGILSPDINSGTMGSYQLYSGVGSGQGGGGSTEGTADLPRLEHRVSVLESSRQDLSTWASIFVGVVTLLVLVNVGLSVWQVGSMARSEVEKFTAEYSKQFASFLQHGRSEISTKLEQYEAHTSDLAHQIDNVSANARQYTIMASTLLADLERETTAEIARLRSEGDRLRADILRIQAAAKKPAGAE